MSHVAAWVVAIGGAAMLGGALADASLHAKEKRGPFVIIMIVGAGLLAAGVRLGL